MGQTIRGKKLEAVFFVVFFALLYINTFVRTGNDTLKEIGETSIDISLVLMAVTLLFSWLGERPKRQDLEGVYISYLLLAAFGLLSYWFTQLVEGREVVRVALLALYVIGSIRMRWRPLHIKVAGHVTSVAVLLFILHWIVSGMPMLFFQSFYRNPNFLGAISFTTLFFILLGWLYSHHLEKLYFGIIFVCNLLLIFIAGARAVFLALLVVLVAWGIYRFRRQWFKPLFYVLMLLIFLFMFTYINLKGTWLGNQLNDLSRAMFNKMNLFSGRSELWSQMWDLFVNNPLFGYGLLVDPRDYEGITQTTHNLYLQIVLEGGLIGLLLFIVFLVFIWRALCQRMDITAARWSAFFMLGILLYDTLELSMHPNMYSIALFQWIILTMGIHFIQPQRRISTRMDRHLLNRL